MFKLITPPGLLLTTAVLAIYAVAAAQVARIEHSWPLAVAAAVAAVASVGTAFMRKWSQWLVHLMTAGFVAKWTWSVWDGYRSGYFDFQFGGASGAAMRSLLPGLAMLMLSVLCSWLVQRHFSSVGRT
ncbi:MAG: hypothetical protein U1E63_17720 [Burkholderiales bacterium]